MINRHPFVPKQGEGNPVKVKPDIKPIKSCRELWCWAACATMILRHLGDETIEQCHIATTILGEQKACCEKLSNCDERCSENQVNTIFEKYHLSSTPVGQIDYSELKKQIDNNKPIELGFKWEDVENGHLVLVDGYVITDEKKLFFLVIDPANRNTGRARYQQLKSAFNKGQWEKTWINIESQQA